MALQSVKLPSREKAAVKWHSTVFLATGVLVILRLVVSGISLSLKRRQSAQRQSPSAPLQHFSLPSCQPESEWKTYKIEEYKFQLHYPKDLLLTKGVSRASLPYPPELVVNLYTARIFNPQHPDQISIPFTIAVYEKPTTLLLVPRLSSACGKELTQVETGDIDTALVRAYAGQTGVVSYNEFQEDSMAVYEVGAVFLHGTLSYSTFFASDTFPYVYGIGIDLDLRKTRKWQIHQIVHLRSYSSK